MLRSSAIASRNVSAAAWNCSFAISAWPSLTLAWACTYWRLGAAKRRAARSTSMGTSNDSKIMGAGDASVKTAHGRADALKPPAGIPAVAAAALLAKLAVVYQLHDHPLLRPVGVLDTAAYFELAQRAAAGDWLLGPSAYYVSPLYIYFLAVVFRVTGAAVLHAQVAQAVLGALGVLLVGRCAGRLYGARAAVIAAALAALT